MRKKREGNNSGTLHTGSSQVPPAFLPYVFHPTTTLKTHPLAVEGVGSYGFVCLVSRGFEAAGGNGS